MGDIKDLKDLKHLFPGMENYVPEQNEKQDTTHHEVNPLGDREKAQMRLYVSRDKKQRGGKQVTLIEGHEGPEDVMEELLKRLKALCSAGGSMKEGELIIQGDHVKKVIDFLLKQGYKQTKQKGGS